MLSKEELDAVVCRDQRARQVRRYASLLTLSFTLVWSSLAVVVLFVAVIGLGRQIGPAWSAHQRHGTPGAFVAQSPCNGPEFAYDCTWTGDFTGEDGSARRGIDFAGHGPTSVGITVPALDTGSPTTVYPADGGTAWLRTSILLLLCACQLLILPLVSIMWRLYRSRVRAARQR